MIRLTDIWRYPVKAHGRERIASATLSPEQGLPWDRIWAIAHENSDIDGSEWARCRNFSRGAGAPQLQAITCNVDEEKELVTFSHPSLDDLTCNPDTDAEALVAWSNQLVPNERAQSARVIRGQGFGFHDTAYQSISIASRASHEAVAQKAGQSFSMDRWRCNLWLDGLDAWEEFGWVGKKIQIGTAILDVRERSVRCLMTHANPETGERDVEILSILDTFGHRDFTIQATVLESGEIRTGDEVTLL